MKNLSRLVTMFDLSTDMIQFSSLLAICMHHTFLAGGFAASVVLGEVEGGGDDGGGGHEDDYGCKPGAPHQSSKEGVLICVARIGLSRWDTRASPRSPLCRSRL